MTLQTTRFNVTLWDCGCLTWIENNEFTHLACNQKLCRVMKVVKEEMLAQGKTIIHAEIIRKKGGK